MMYKTEVIRQAAKLLDAVGDDGNNIIETFFNDKEKRIEVWNMLAGDEKMVASVGYNGEQEQAYSSVPPKFSCVSFGGCLIPVLAKGVAELIEINRSVMRHIFIFDDEKEELRITSSDGFPDTIIKY